MFGVLLMLMSASMLPPIGVSAWYSDGEVRHFVWTLFISLTVGFVLWWPVRGQHHGDLRKRDGFLVVALFWVVLSLIGALPFMFGPHLTLVDAVFEAVSGFTTTGSTVITGLDELPRSILYYRQQLQWLGGLGVVVLAVAILPMLGVGGMQLYRVEVPGPMRDEKLTPRIQDTARALWTIYLGLTAACALAFWLAGMDLFDAIGHSFSTISTGGFSPHDLSMGYFENPAIEVVADVFMLLGAMNFSMHFLVWRSGKIRTYVRDEEARTFLLIVACVTMVMALVLTVTAEYETFIGALRYAAFHVISVITSTGFTTVDFSVWPLALPVLLMFVSFVGGCAGSSAGGLKVFRVLLLVKQGGREIGQLVHPSAILPVKVNNATVSERTAQSVWGFFAVYLASFALLMLLMMFAGLDQVSAFGAVATCMNNLGPGLGEVSGTFGGMDDMVKWLGAFAMLLGRLEVFAFLVLLTPGYWRS